MSKTKIMIVEDEKILAMGLKRKLEKLGYLITDTASSGQEALGKVAKNLPDLVLMDIVLKGDMDGIETAEELVKLYNLPIIYTTAYADDDIIQRAALTRPYGYLLKPFKEREVKANIEMAIHKKLSEKEEIQDFEDIYRDVTSFLQDKDELFKKILLDIDADLEGTDFSVDIGTNNIYVSTERVKNLETSAKILSKLALKFIKNYGGDAVLYPKGDVICLELTKPELNEV